jgi:muramoyltetrapeptide carboxypeptidase
MSLLLPPRLQPGARIGIIAPASPPIDTLRIEAGIDWLHSRGFEVERGVSVDARDGYLAGTDDIRFHDLQSMFADPGIAAIFCLRGGYGSGRLLEHIDFSALRSTPKILLGFSDITALSMALIHHARLVNFGGPMVAVEMANGMTEDSEASLWSVLMQTDFRPQYHCDPAATVHSGGSVEGRLLGGNLAVLVSLLGTPYFPDLRGAVLLIEDVGESVYRIDRMLLQLKLSGHLSGIHAVLLGSFTDIPDDQPNRSLDAVFRDHFIPLDVPILGGFPFGHIAEKVTVPWGASVRVDTSAHRVDVLQAAVR